MPLNTPYRLALLVTDVLVRCTPTICPLLNFDMCPVMLCGLNTLLLLMECEISEDGQANVDVSFWKPRKQESLVSMQGK